MRESTPATIAEVLDRIAPENWTIEFENGCPTLGLTIAGVADYILSHAGEPIGPDGVLALLAKILPSAEYLAVAREVDRRREVSADA